MSRTKISELTEIDAVQGTDSVVVVDSTDQTTKKALVSKFTRGDTGAQGPQGPTGPRGAQGEDGDQQPFTVLSNDLVSARAGQRILTKATSPFNITLPTANAGDFIMVADGNGTWGTNNVTINSANIEGEVQTLVLDVPNAWAELYYDGDTWRVRSAIGVAGPAGATGPQGPQGAAGTFTVATDIQIGAGSNNSVGITPAGLANTRPVSDKVLTWSGYEYETGTLNTGDIYRDEEFWNISNANAAGLYSNIAPDSYITIKNNDTVDGYEEGRVLSVYTDDNNIRRFKLYANTTGSNSFLASNTCTITTEGALNDRYSTLYVAQSSWRNQVPNSTSYNVFPRAFNTDSENLTDGVDPGENSWVEFTPHSVNSQFLLEVSGKPGWLGFAYNNEIDLRLQRILQNVDGTWPNWNTSRAAGSNGDTVVRSDYVAEWRRARYGNLYWRYVYKPTGDAQTRAQRLRIEIRRRQTTGSANVIAESTTTVLQLANNIAANPSNSDAALSFNPFVFSCVEFV